MEMVHSPVRGRQDSLLVQTAEVDSLHEEFRAKTHSHEICYEVERTHIGWHRRLQGSHTGH